MRVVIIREDALPEHVAALRATLESALYKAEKDFDVEVWHNEKGSMTVNQFVALWQICKRYNVPFREDDYRRSAFGTSDMFEGWLGGETHATMGSDTTTIYVGVEADGNIHS